MIGALGWSLAERFGLEAIQFVISIILARLLLPSTFGLIGMLSLFIAVARCFIDSGFGSALIQKADVDHADQSSVFIFNVAAGVLLTSLLCVLAPIVAKFYRQPVLAPLTRFMSLGILFSSLGAVQSTLMAKRLDFKAQTQVSLIASMLSGAAGIILAVRGAGVWSLAVQSVGGNLLRTACLWVFSPWRPTLFFRLASLKGLFGYGSRLLGSSLIDTFFQNIYQVVIGKIFSANDLGYYARAKSMENVLSISSTQPLSRVMFPGLALIQNDVTRLRQAYRKAIRVTVFLHFPLMLGLAAVARPLITLLLTPKWEPSVPYLQLLCLAALLYPLHVLNLNVLKVKGRSDLFLRLEILKKGIIVLAIALTYRWGVMGMLYGQLCTSVIAYILNSFYSGRLIGYPLRAQVLDILPSLLLSALMAVACVLVGYLAIPVVWIHLLLQCAVGVVLYLGLSYLFNIPILTEILDMARRLPISKPTLGEA